MSHDTDEKAGSEHAVDAAGARLEWDMLRAEIVRRDEQSFKIMTGGITVATALLTLFFTVAETSGGRLPVALYYIPFAIMLPSLYLIINNAHAVARIAGYIRVFLEPGNGLRWEGALGRFFNAIPDNRYGMKSFAEAEVMTALFVALGALNAVVFGIRGDWSWLPPGPLGIVVQAALLLLPFGAFVDARMRLGARTCARHHYYDVWQDVWRQCVADGCAPGVDRSRSPETRPQT